MAILKPPPKEEVPAEPKPPSPGDPGQTAQSLVWPWPVDAALDTAIAAVRAGPLANSHYGPVVHQVMTTAAAQAYSDPNYVMFYTRMNHR